MINDDWSFARLLQSMLWHGELAATGWGKGGPAAIVHILWGGLFTAVGGFSVTTLRISVLVLGVAGSFLFLRLLESCKASSWIALAATLTLVLNPLFLSQCFTFMTDITFAFLIICSLYFLDRGERQHRTTPFSIGLLFALGAILTRQIGIVIPSAFCMTMLLHPVGRRFGRIKMCALAIIVCVVPWIAFEIFLYSAGSTPVTDHQVVANIIEKPLRLGPTVLYHYARLLVLSVGYTALLVSPIMALQYRQLWPSFRFRLLVYLLATSLVVVEAAILLGAIDPPVKLHQNVIFNFGIGPVLLKDTYILGIERTSTIPKTAYYGMALWGLLACCVLVGHIYSTVKQWMNSIRKAREVASSFMGMFCLISALLYGTVIIFTGSFDRYFIPIFILILVWLCADVLRGWRLRSHLWQTVPALLPCIVMAVVSPLMVSDFMSFKRSLSKAQKYLLEDLHADPCDVDGGFEFNGYHCYRKDFVPQSGLSWWWVDRENYLLTLGPLTGYEIVRTFPFQRYLGQAGSVFVLRPKSEAS